MAKVNQQTMKTQYDGQYDTFCRKNHDYGNSFEESLDQFGIVASIVRMSDKMNRLASLTDESKTQQVGSESLLDTLEDLSNYAAMTACWLKGVEKDNEVSGTDTDDIIRYNIQDVGNILKRSAEMEKEFNNHIPSKVENIDPRNYILNMLSDIFRVVQMKLDKDEMLAPLDISDEAGLIAKAIMESQTEEECGAVINNYMCTRKDIPYELKDWIYGIIAHYSYYLKKERTEYGENTIYADNKPVVIYKEDTSKYEADVTIGKSRAVLSAITGMDCFDLEPGHIPEISITQKGESKNIYEELEELFVKQNEHIKVLLTSSAGKTDITPLAILDYKSKTSEAINGYDLMVALDCLIPNLSKEGLEHFIDVANNVLKMKDFGDA